MAEDKLEFEGIVTSARGNGMFLVSLKDVQEESVVMCTLSGKIRKNNIRVIEGDTVRVEVSVYDTAKGRITFRMKK